VVADLVCRASNFELQITSNFKSVRENFNGRFWGLHHLMKQRLRAVSRNHTDVIGFRAVRRRQYLVVVRRSIDISRARGGPLIESIRSIHAARVVSLSHTQVGM